MASFTLKVGFIAPLFLVLMMLLTTQGLLEEPGECGRFQFQEKVLEKMVVLDHTMKVTLTELETKLKQYESENAKLKNNLEILQAKLEANVEKSNEALAEELNILRANYKQVTNTQSAQQQQLVFGFGELRSNISEEMDVMMEKMKNITDKTGSSFTREPVVFIAYLSGGDRDPTVGQPIIFNQEVQNYAHAYSTSDGMFTPPVAGVYHFSAQMCTSDKDRVAVQIVSSSRVYAVGAFREEYDATCSSMTTVAVLEKDEKVWVKCVDSDDNAGGKALEGDTPNEFRTMFNGVLIHAIA